MQGLEDGVARIDSDVYKGILAKLVRTYQYFNQNKEPDKVVIPHLLEIDGVPIEMEEPEEEEHAVVGRDADTTEFGRGNPDSDIQNNPEIDG